MEPRCRRVQRSYTNEKAVLLLLCHWKASDGKTRSARKAIQFVPVPEAEYCHLGSDPRGTSSSLDLSASVHTFLGPSR